MSFQTEALTHSRGEEVTVFSFSLKGKAGDGEKSITCAYERDDSASFFQRLLVSRCAGTLVSCLIQSRRSLYTADGGEKKIKETATRETPSCSSQT